MKEFIDGKSQFLPTCLDFIVNLFIESVKFELCVSLSHEYPLSEPEIFIRNHKFNRNQHIEVNKKLGEFIAELPKGEPCIFTAISWLQDVLLQYTESVETPVPRLEEKDDTLVRFWIYSHHIYSKTKRREIVDLAHQLKLTGFSMPGKPGVICVEGHSSDCNEWWQTVRSLNWKKIICKVTEENNEKKSTFLKFENFEEVIFGYQGGAKINHMDKGEFYKFLEAHKLGYIFKELFGVDGKAP
ncbi:RWD domain-containing protein 2A isoform X2 [Cylas formicarius]|nr:RWD domain-containing protein 2A isoform X2 [Cylas formicarius]